jgi:predicted MPP superfamily phosphohydrolase
VTDTEWRAGTRAGTQAPPPTAPQEGPFGQQCAPTDPPLDDEPPVRPTDLLHHALVGLHLLTHLPPPALALLLLALAVGQGLPWAWGTGAPWAGWLAGGVYLAFLLADWAWLASLPRRGLSFGPVAPPLIGLSLARWLLGLLSLLLCLAGLSPTLCAAIGAVLQALVLGLVLYSTGIEPFALGVTHLELVSAKLPPGAHLRLVQVSDLHVERVTRRERELVERVRELDADYVLLTGDYLNLSYIGERRAIDETRWVLSRLHARKGLYAVRGTHQVDPNWVLPVLFEGLSIRWLRNESCLLQEAGFELALAGASSTRRTDIDGPAVDRALADVPRADAAQRTFVVFLFHIPDAVPQAQAAGVDLYLAGHTHGGQLRLPGFGALVTGTDSGKRYEMGRYDLDGLTLYVSRGLGMEGMAAPRARFLSPPEIVCIDVVGTTSPPLSLRAR